jgi:outer membrane murein-binding lipoprotein Lpp
MKRFNWLLTGVIVSCLSIVLLAGCGVSKDEYEALQAEKANVETQLAAAQSDLTSLQADYDTLNVDYQAASDELAQLKETYPPQIFHSRNTLEKWVSENIQPHSQFLEDWFQSAWDVYQQGLRDGYSILVMFDADATNPTGAGWIFNGALVNGVLYIWDPEVGELFDQYSDYTICSGCK